MPIARATRMQPEVAGAHVLPHGAALLPLGQRAAEPGDRLAHERHVLLADRGRAGARVEQLVGADTPPPS